METVSIQGESSMDFTEIFFHMVIIKIEIDIVKL